MGLKDNYKRIEDNWKTAMNDTVPKSDNKGGGCFVATAAFGDYDAPEVVFLRAFRDESLSRSAFGRGFVRAYYKISPPLAKIIAGSDSLRRIARRFFLRPVISWLERGRRK